MVRRLNLFLPLLFLLCLISALYCLYLYKFADPLAGVHCESLFRLSHHLVDSKNKQEGIDMDGSVSLIFTGNKQGLMIIGGLISDGKKNYKFKQERRFSFSSTSNAFYQFNLEKIQALDNDETPQEILNLLFSKIGNTFEITYLDKKNLLISNLFSPIQICNITS